MEENETSPDPDYLKGFNEGYLMNKFEPELSKSLLASLTDSPRSAGFKDGYQEYILEKSSLQKPKWLNKDRFSLPQKIHEKDKDIDKDYNE